MVGRRCRRRRDMSVLHQTVEHNAADGVHDRGQVRMCSALAALPRSRMPTLARSLQSQNRNPRRPAGSKNRSSCHRSRRNEPRHTANERGCGVRHPESPACRVQARGRCVLRCGIDSYVVRQVFGCACDRNWADFATRILRCTLLRAIDILSNAIDNRPQSDIQGSVALEGFAMIRTNGSASQYAPNSRFS